MKTYQAHQNPNWNLAQQVKMVNWSKAIESGIHLGLQRKDTEMRINTQRLNNEIVARQAPAQLDLLREQITGQRLTNRIRRIDERVRTAEADETLLAAKRNLKISTAKSQAMQMEMQIQDQEFEAVLSKDADFAAASLQLTSGDYPSAYKSLLKLQKMYPGERLSRNQGYSRLLATINQVSPNVEITVDVIGDDGKTRLVTMPMEKAIREGYFSERARLATDDEITNQKMNNIFQMEALQLGMTDPKMQEQYAQSQRSLIDSRRKIQSANAEKASAILKWADQNNNNIDLIRPVLLDQDGNLDAIITDEEGNEVPMYKWIDRQPDNIKGALFAYAKMTSLSHQLQLNKAFDTFYTMQNNQRRADAAQQQSELLAPLSDDKIGLAAITSAVMNAGFVEPKATPYDIGLSFMDRVMRGLDGMIDKIPRTEANKERYDNLVAARDKVLGARDVFDTSFHTRPLIKKGAYQEGRELGKKIDTSFVPRRGLLIPEFTEWKQVAWQHSSRTTKTKFADSLHEMLTEALGDVLTEAERSELLYETAEYATGVNMGYIQDELSAANKMYEDVMAGSGFQNRLNLKPVSGSEQQE